MWILICGSLANGKQVIAEHLEKHHGFTFLREKPASSQLSGLSVELDWFVQRLHNHKKAQADMDETDTVTIRSLWDQKEVFIPTFQDDYLPEYQLMQRLFNEIESQLKPPHMIIFMRGRKLDAYNRMELTGRERVNEAVYDKVQSLYEEFIHKIGIPVVEIEPVSADKIIDMVEYGVASIKASKLSDQTIWTRKFYR
jgi:deoxyadenosine/deoxycytidine kinase